MRKGPGLVFVVWWVFFVVVVFLGRLCFTVQASFAKQKLNANEDLPGPSDPSPVSCGGSRLPCTQCTNQVCLSPRLGRSPSFNPGSESEPRLPSMSLPELGCQPSCSTFDTKIPEDPKPPRRKWLGGWNKSETGLGEQGCGQRLWEVKGNVSVVVRFYI